MLCLSSWMNLMDWRMKEKNYFYSSFLFRFGLLQPICSCSKYILNIFILQNWKISDNNFLDLQKKYLFSLLTFSTSFHFFFGNPITEDNQSRLCDKTTLCFILKVSFATFPKITNLLVAHSISL